VGQDGAAALDDPRVRAAAVRCRHRAAVTELTDRIVAEHGRLDILVANAGICVLGPVADLPDDVWRDTIETNLSGAFYCIRAALPHMTRQRYGRIVAISSGAARGGTPAPSDADGAVLYSRAVLVHGG
jgi:NAD(P)-dependent dehydrogenase (short-subunit alcohol dehydrogenase family)